MTSVHRIAANEPSFLSGHLRVQDQRDKQKLNIKALDVVLFGPPTREKSPSYSPSSLTCLFIVGPHFPDISPISYVHQHCRMERLVRRVAIFFALWLIYCLLHVYNINIFVYGVSLINNFFAHLKYSYANQASSVYI